MKVKTNKNGKSSPKGCNTSFIITLVVCAVLVYVAWYAYCHYYPVLLNRSSVSVSSDIVNNEFRFGDVNSIHLTAARKNGISPVANRNLLPTKSLMMIRNSGCYKIDRLTHSVPYLTPAAAELLNEIGEDFQTLLEQQGFEKHRLIVTSVLRTSDDVARLRKVNDNASVNSTHQYATTFDITYIRFDRMSLFGKSATNEQLANILGSVLKQMRDKKRCYVKYERKQRCFHITSRQ